MPTLLVDGWRGIVTSLLVECLLMIFLWRWRATFGIFIRDIYWKFEPPTFFPVRRWWRLPFYWLDFLYYHIFADRVFLPTNRMANYLPDSLKSRSEELPPGMDVHKGRSQPKRTFLYVGGMGDHYDLSLVLETFLELGHLHCLKIVCRKDEWDRFQWRTTLPENIQILHLAGAALEEVYNDTAVCLLFFPPSVYRSFAAPFKLFEYLGHCKPIITTHGTWAGDFVAEHGAGWVLSYTKSDLKKCIEQLDIESLEYQTMITRIENLNQEHAWGRRVDQILLTLSRLRRERPA